MATLVSASVPLLLLLLLLLLHLQPSSVVADDSNSGAGGDIDGSSCQSWLISDFDREVAQVTSGKELKEAIASSNALLVNVNAINGTQWLNLGGKLDSFDLVLGIPPATSSDMTLKEALETTNQGWAPRGIIIGVFPDSLTSQVMTLIRRLGSQNQPVWLSRSFESVLGQQPPFEIATNVIWDQEFSLDSVVARITSEALFLPADLQRVLSVLGKVHGQQKFDDADVRFLKKKYRRIERNTFTELFLQSLLQLIERKREAAKGRGRGRVGRRGQAAAADEMLLLPDLQESNSEYKLADVRRLGRLLAEAEAGAGGDSSNSCVLVSVRAGVLAKPTSSQNFRQLLDEHKNVVLIAFAKAYDRVSQQDLDLVRSVLGKDRVLFQVSKDQVRRSKTIPATTTVAGSRGADDSGTGDLIMPSLITILCSAVIALKSYRQLF